MSANGSPRWLSASRDVAHRGSLPRDRWTVSYVDALTILVVFFAAAAAQMAARIPNTATNPLGNPKLMEPLRQLHARGIDARLTPAGLVVTLPQAVLFTSGDDEIADSARPLVQTVAGVLARIPNRVRLAGYADARPIRGGRFRNNWELAAARGLRLLEMLSEEFAISEDRLSVESFGAYAPRDSNDTAAGRAQNRRVEILILN